MEKFRIAFASNDGIKFNKEYFGDSNYYHIYEIGEKENWIIKTIQNNTKDIGEEIHADPKKARGVSGMLKKEGVQIIASGVFGPNIKRINKQFVCLICKNINLQESIQQIQENLVSIKEEWNKGEKRKHLVFNPDNAV